MKRRATENEFNRELDSHLSRWNHTFTFISIIHAAFLGAFLSKIQYLNQTLTIVEIFGATTSLSFALYEIHGMGFNEISNALAKKYGLKTRIFSLVALPVVPGMLILASDLSQPSGLYVNLAVITIFSWLASSLTAGWFIAADLRRGSSKPKTKADPGPAVSANEQS
ncbi:MAG: hypothetical protein ACM3IG_06175 [Myxococcales bacterium]